ncbi:uncharacterized protein LOC121386122 [Gigantopelta aegis]|uniref:uncharacterized protein LOC121386122 n=1 Tax=Gigantopelta aegis TaxID=1735272 RepID=UPI001B88DA24|nr:uncharacterized protein LOC121386122 [Gigantopelta aegis]
MVFAKKDTEGEEVPFPVLMADTTFPDGEATRIKPPGLLLQRQQYLYKSIREFVDDPFKDIVCPRPDEMLPANSDEEELNDTENVENRRARRAMCKHGYTN